MRRSTGAPTRLAVDRSIPPLAMEFAPHGSAVYLRLSDEHAARTVVIEVGALADYAADGALVGFEFLDLDAPAFPHVPERVKTRFSAEAPALGSVEAVPARAGRCGSAARDSGSLDSLLSLRVPPRSLQPPM